MRQGYMPGECDGWTGTFAKMLNSWSRWVVDASMHVGWEGWVRKRMYQYTLDGYNRYIDGRVNVCQVPRTE